MKKIILLVAAAVLLQVIFVPGIFAKEEKKLESVINLSGAWALYPMAVKWGEEFQKIHPGVKIDIAAGGAGKGMTDALTGGVDIGMVSRDINPEEAKKGAFGFAVTKDAVVPVINESNPVVKDILVKGIEKEIFIDIWITNKITMWGEVVGSDSKAKINVYTRSDACGAAETWAKYLGKKQENLKGIGIFGDPDIANAVKKDVLGIGYNNINFIYDPTSKKPTAGLKIAPVDINGNGKIDDEEKLYDTRDAIVKAIAEGKYPSPPARELFFVTKGNPTNSLVKEFIKWVLTDGQKYVPETGYINLTDKKLKSELDKLEGKKESKTK